MAIITFWSNEERETGQTLSMVALSTYLAVEHNYRILDISTGYKNKVLESCYWDISKENNLRREIIGNNDATQIGIESGVEGLIQVINANQTSSNNISNYTKVVFNDRLDVLCAPKTTDILQYKEIAQFYPSIIQLANRNYDLVFVDISNRMPQEIIRQILEFSNVIVVNITQNMQIIDNFITLRENNEFFKKNNILINVGRYDTSSKYNSKNITRYLKEKKEIQVIPYNTLFFEACTEGKVADLFLRVRKINVEDNNFTFMNETSRFAKSLIYKLQELQYRT